MRKLLFLLLLTVASYGQVSTGQEQEFDYGIKNNSSQNVASPNMVVVEGVDGTYGKSSVNVLPLSTATINALKLKADLSTGLIKNGLISINADPTKFDISAGIGIISNFDNPETPVSTIINFPAFTGVTPTYLTTGNITYVAINSTPTIVMQATPFTAIQRRDLIVLGAVIHSNLTNINVVNNISAPSNAIGNQLHDFIEAVGVLNITGNKYSANGANLSLNKSAGSIFKFGVNFATDWKNPHQISQSSGTALTFRYRTQNGTEGTDRTSLDPTTYDLNNVLTAVPNNKFIIETVIMFQTGLTRVLKGQNYYDDLASAQAAIFTRDFVMEANSKENGVVRAYIIMKNNATSLQNTTDSRIIEAQKFGGVASGGVALTFANIVSALGYTPANDADVLHKSGNETFTGVKTSVNTGASQINGLDLTNDGTTGSQVLFLTNNQMGAGMFFRNFLSGQGLSGDNAGIGNLINLNSRTASIGNLIALRKNGVTTTFFDHNGVLNPAGILMPNETASTIASFDASKNLKSLATATYPNLTELSYVKNVTGSIQPQINAKATDANVIHKTLDEVKTGSLTLNSLILPENVSSATGFNIGQVMSINDYWKIYGSSAVTDRGDLVFEIGDNGLPGITGQRFRFYIKSGSSGVDKDPLIVEYDKITATTDITSSQTVTGQSLAVDTGALLFPNNTFYGGVNIPIIVRSGNKLGFRSSITSNSQLLFNTDGLSTDQTVTWSNVSGTVAVTLNGSASLDFPSTGAGLSSELTISVTGAVDGDTVVLGIPDSSSLSNTCYTARVSSANTVSVKLNNYSAAPADPNTGTFKVKIIK